MVALDSWVTNIAAVASLLTATWTQLGTGSPPLVSANAGPAILILFIHQLCSDGRPSTGHLRFLHQAANVDQTKNQGTVAGYVLAAFATLFAVGGEITALGMFTAKAILTGSARDILVGFLVADAAFVALYSWRTMYNVLTADTVTAPATTAPASTALPRSLLLVPANKRSATL